MKRLFKTICFVLPLAALLFASCEEVQEASKYDNWQSRNEAYIDSIAGETGKVFVATLEDADRMEPGRLFAIATTDSKPVHTGSPSSKVTRHDVFAS